MKLTDEEIVSNYQTLLELINTHIVSDRKEKLLALYDLLGDRIATAPASSINSFHGCYAGGYVKHVIDVVNNSIAMHEVWGQSGADLSTYSLEELIFSAINHDLGKIGDMELDYYVPNTSEWHVKNQGKVYNINPKITNMSVPDRSIWILQNFGIHISENEFLAIKLHDGPYVEENKPYFNAFQEERKIRSNIVFVLHYADYMSARIEYEREKSDRVVNTVNNTHMKSNNTPFRSKLSEDTALKSANDLFAKMFDGKGKETEKE